MYLNKKQIYDRGWSPTMIKKLLGDPDKIQSLGKHCEEHLFSIARIESTEKLEDFKTAQSKYLTRRNAGKQAAKTQTTNRIENARMMTIRVQRMSNDKVLEEAIEHFNFRRRGRHWDDDVWANKDSDQFFLERITVNFVRHELTSYDRTLRGQRGRIGGDEAAPIIRRRVFEEIICAYPHLEDECFRQMLSRNLITEAEIDNRKKPLHEQLLLPF